MGQHQTDQKKWTCRAMVTMGHQCVTPRQQDLCNFPIATSWESPSYTPPWSVSICPSVGITLALEESTFSNDLPTVDELLSPHPKWHLLGSSLITV